MNTALDGIGPFHVHPSPVELTNIGRQGDTTIPSSMKIVLATIFSEVAEEDMKKVFEEAREVLRRLF